MHATTDVVAAALHELGRTVVVVPSKDTTGDEVVMVTGFNRYVVIAAGGLAFVNEPAARGAANTLWCEFLHEATAGKETLIERLAELLSFFSLPAEAADVAPSAANSLH